MPNKGDLPPLIPKFEGQLDNFGGIPPPPPRDQQDVKSRARRASDWMDCGARARVHYQDRDSNHLCEALNEGYRQDYRQYTHRFVSRCQILRGKSPSISQKRGLCPLKRGHSIQMLYNPLPNKGDLPPLIPKFEGQLDNLGESPPPPPPPPPPPHPSL